MSVNLSLPRLPAIRGIFITGTDTDVGKTWVAAGLTAALRQRGVPRFISNRSRAAAPRQRGVLCQPMPSLPGLWPV